LDEEEEKLTELRERYAFQFVAAYAVVLVGAGTAFYMVVEDWSLVDALYFCVVTSTTVGFGDLSPTTDLAKLFTIFYILSSVGLIGYAINLRLRRKAKRRARKYSQRHAAATRGAAAPSQHADKEEDEEPESGS
jgi:hypothetical protein